MSEAATPEHTEQPDEEADSGNSTPDSPELSFEFSGPATFERDISGSRDVVARHQDVRVEGTVPLDTDLFFAVVDPKAEKSREMIFRYLLERTEIRDGYQVNKPEHWAAEISGTVKDWCEITLETKSRVPWDDHSKKKVRFAAEILDALRQAELLDRSGLLAMLELDKEAVLSADERQEVLNDISELSLHE